MSFTMSFETACLNNNKATRSHSAQGGRSLAATCGVKIPLPPRLWISDGEDESSDDGSVREDGNLGAEKPRVRSRYRHFKKRGAIPLGIFWDIENCHVPRGCSALDVVAAIRAKFLTGRREADFVVVCDVRKESAFRLQELNDAQISLIHVCGTQKNAADEKLRQCMRRFSELHSAPAALLLISGDINFAADLSDFRHRKNMEVILVHKRETSQALIACSSSHYYFSDITANLPRNKKALSHSEEDEDPTCELEVMNLPLEHPPEKVAKRLRRLADNCGGKVLRIDLSTAILRFSTPDHASRALKRMDGEDVFGFKISTRYSRSAFAPAYSSDEGYSTAPPPPSATAPLPLPPPPPAPALAPPARPLYAHAHAPHVQASPSPVEVTAQEVCVRNGSGGGSEARAAAAEWALALRQLPPAPVAPLAPCASAPSAPRMRQIRGTHGSAVNLDRSGCSSANSLEGCRERERDLSASRAQSPWNCSMSFSEHSDCDENAELTVSNLPPFDPLRLQEMLTQLFRQFVSVVRVCVWAGADGPLACVVLRSEWDARLAIARLHKRRLDAHWNGRRLELSLGRPCPTPSLDVLRARLRAILLDHTPPRLPLLRLRDAYASRHATALTTSDLAKVKDTVIIHEGFGRIVQLIDLTPVSNAEMEEAPWKCQIHAGLNTSHEDGSRILQPVYMEIATLERHVQLMLETHGGIVPLLTFVECYEAMFPPLVIEETRGVALELLLRSVRGIELRDVPSRHLAPRPASPVPLPSAADLSDSSRWSGSGSGSGSGVGERERPRTAPVLEPMLALFERELVDLLKSAPRCCIPFSKLIPAFHHHFGRQCRVADYGFTKLPDLLAALSATIVVLGSGSSRVITISAAAQARRWTSDLVKVLKSQPGRAIYPHEIPHLYQAALGRPFSPVDYGVCTMRELLARVQSDAVLVAQDGSVSLPRRTPTPEERARSVHFAMQAVELLCYTAHLRMEFSRFVPAYHAHFGQQLRVAHYGCVKLLELFELVPEAIAVSAEPSGERTVRLAPKAAKAVIAQRLESITPVSFAAFPAQYAAQYGAAPQPEALDVCSLEALVYACGGSIEEGVVRAAGDSPRWATSQLVACAVLAADRSVARGSTQEYFISAFRQLRGFDPEIHNLEASGVLEVCDRRLVLTSGWRVALRVAQLLADQPPRTALDILHDYCLRYDPTCTNIKVEGMVEVLWGARAVFAESGGRWAVRAGVWLPCPYPSPTPSPYPAIAAAPAATTPALPQDDYSVLDTPPGQKGSRVFESPRVNLWSSPPASALPAPTALLPPDNKRRTRLAAHFNASS